MNIKVRRPSAQREDRKKCPTFMVLALVPLTGIPLFQHAVWPLIEENEIKKCEPRTIVACPNRYSIAPSPVAYQRDDLENNPMAAVLKNTFRKKIWRRRARATSRPPVVRAPLRVDGERALVRHVRVRIVI